jgi:hypothetical protein
LDRLISTADVVPLAIGTEQREAHVAVIQSLKAFVKGFTAAAAQRPELWVVVLGCILGISHIARLLSG